MLNEVHGDQIPWFLGNRELLEITVWSVSGSFGSSAGCARLTVVLDVCSDTRPCIIPTDKIQGFVLTIMTRDRMIMIVE